MLVSQSVNRLPSTSNRVMQVSYVSGIQNKWLILVQSANQNLISEAPISRRSNWRHKTVIMSKRENKHYKQQRRRVTTLTKSVEQSLFPFPVAAVLPAETHACKQQSKKNIQKKIKYTCGFQ